MRITPLVVLALPLLLVAAAAAQNTLGPRYGTSANDKPRAAKPVGTETQAGGEASVPDADEDLPSAEAPLTKRNPRAFIPRGSEVPLPVETETEIAAPAASGEPLKFVPVQPNDPIAPAVVDDAVKPVTLEDGTRMIPVRSPEKESLADRLLRQALSPPESDSLSGKPITLSDVLIAKESLQTRHVELVHAYWKLCAAIARYHFALDEQRTLEQATDAYQHSLAATAAITAYRARTAQARVAAVEEQHKLTELMQRKLSEASLRLGDEALPLPVDRPVVGAYRTYYETLFATRSANELTLRQARRLHETLPLRLDSVRALADSVVAAEDVVVSAAKPQTSTHLDKVQYHLDVPALLLALTNLRLQRRALADEVLAYNLAIADYALLAAPAGSTPSDLLPMLIKVRPRTTEDQGINAASAANPVLTAGAAPILPADAPSAGVIQAGAELPLSSTAPAPALPPSAASATPPTSNDKPLRSVLVRSGVNR